MTSGDGSDQPPDPDPAKGTEQPVTAAPSPSAPVAAAASKVAATDVAPIDAKPAPISEREIDGKPEAKVDAVQSDAKIEAKPAVAKSDPEVEAKPAAKVEAKPAAKIEAKPAAKVEAKPAAKPPKPEPVEDEVSKLPEAPPWWKTLRADPPAHLRMVLGIGLITILFALWWLLTRGDMLTLEWNGRTALLDLKVIPSVDRVISYVKIPSPGEVFGSFGALLDRELSQNLTDTLQRVLTGVGLAALVGVSFGVLSASHRGVNAALSPLVIFLRSVPMGAMIPLTLMLFGDGETQKTRFIFLAIVPFVFSDTVKAVSIVPERYVETAQTLGASRFQIIRKVLVPLALPDIITSLRFQLGLALGYIMLAEEINTEYGLGKLIMGSQRQGPYEHVYLLLFVIATIAFMIDLVLRTLQRGLFAWRRDL